MTDHRQNTKDDPAGHPAIEAEEIEPRTDRHLRRRNPFEEMPAGDEQPHQGSRDRIAHQPRLMRQQGDDERRSGRARCADRRRARPRWLRGVIPARRGTMALTTGMRAGSRIVEQDEADPHRRGSERQRQSRQQRQHAGRCGQRSPQIVEHLPAADRRDGAARPIRAGDRSATEHPRQQLPVAARPTVVAPRGDVVAGGEVLDDLDVGGETGAGEDALEQIVAEQGRVRHAVGERGLEGIDVVDALAGIGAFAEQILVNVGDGGGIRVDAVHAGEDALEQGTLAADRQRRA